MHYKYWLPIIYQVAYRDIDKVSDCANVEQVVIDIIEDDRDCRAYVEFRKQMFAVLMRDNPENLTFQKTLTYFKSL